MSIFLRFIHVTNLKMGNKKNNIRKKSVLMSKRKTGKENYKKRSKEQPRTLTTPLMELQPVNFNTPAIDKYMDDLNNTPLIVEAEKENFEPVRGRRIVVINYLLLQLQDKAHHSDLFDCKPGYFQLIGDKRTGLISKLKLKCNMCQTIIQLDSENPENADTVNVNIAATSGIVATGIGFSQFEELFSAMDVPVFASSYYTELQNIVYDNWEKTATESMEAAANREKQAAIAEGRMKDGYALVDVYVDGAWCLRSYGNNYRANSGTAAIIGKRFGEVLYMAVKNKYCVICARAEKIRLDPNEHKCYKNYRGSSSAMEDIICEGFKASKEMYGIIYARMIGQLDSGIGMSLSLTRTQHRALAQRHVGRGVPHGRAIG